MRKSAFVIVPVAGLAFAAGRFVPATVEPVALGAQPEEQTQISPEDMARMQAGQPGEHHAVFEQLVGQWEGSFTIRMDPDAPAFTTTGSVNRQVIMGGRFLTEHVQANTDMGPFEGMAAMGYNNFDQCYESVWIDSTATCIISETATYNPDTKVFTSHGSHRDPGNGAIYHVRGTFDISNPDRHVYTGYATGPDGREFKSFEGVLERIQD